MNTTTEIRNSYKELLLTDEWRMKRSQIIERDGNRCCFCEASEQLEVHHRQYHIIKKTKEYRKPWQYTSNNLLTLCNTCHRAGHAKYKIPVINI